MPLYRGVPVIRVGARSRFLTIIGDADRLFSNLIGSGPLKPIPVEGEEAQIPSGPEGDDPQLRGRIYVRSLTSKPLIEILLQTGRVHI